MRKGPNIILHHFVYWPVEVNKCHVFYVQWNIFERPYLNQFKQFSETVFFFLLDLYFIPEIKKVEISQFSKNDVRFLFSCSG